MELPKKLKKKKAQWSGMLPKDTDLSELSYHTRRQIRKECKT